jgi:hypothetical protein
MSVWDDAEKAVATATKPSVWDEAEKALPPVRGGNLRLDGTPKGLGYFGPLGRPDGQSSTELSIGVDFDGKDRLIPSIVPTLTKPELESLLAGEKPSPAIVGKATEHAKARLRAGKSPFAGEGEQSISPMAVGPVGQQALQTIQQEGGLGIHGLPSGPSPKPATPGTLSSVGRAAKQLANVPSELVKGSISGTVGSLYDLWKQTTTPWGEVPPEPGKMAEKIAAKIPAPEFDIRPAMKTSEKIGDVGVGVVKFAGEVALLKKAAVAKLGAGAAKIGEGTYWAVQAWLNGQNPAWGFAQGKAFGALEGLPSKTTVDKGVKLLAESGVLGASTKASGGTPQETAIAAAIPFGMKAVQAVPGAVGRVTEAAIAKKEALPVEPPAAEPIPATPQAVAEAAPVHPTIETAPKIEPPTASQGPSLAPAAGAGERARQMWAEDPYEQWRKEQATGATRAATNEPEPTGQTVVAPSTESANRDHSATILRPNRDQTATPQGLTEGAPAKPLIERIVRAAADTEPKYHIVERNMLMGTDGKWHSGWGLPKGVETTGEKKPYFVFADNEGTTYGKQYQTREEAETHSKEIREGKDAEFRSQLEGMSKDELDRQAAYWLKETRPEPASATKEESPKSTARRGKKLLGAQQIGDFEQGRDKVVRQGDRTFVVDTKGEHANIEVVSDVMTPENEANIRKLPVGKLAEYRQQTADTPYLSPEGKAERLRIFDEVMGRSSPATKPSTAEPQGRTEGAPTYPTYDPMAPATNREAIIAGLRDKGFEGTIDRLNRGKITLEQANAELNGIGPELPKEAGPPNPADFASQLKGQGVGKQNSWSRWVQRTSLRPGMDAKDWYKIYDSVTPSSPAPGPEGKEPETIHPWQLKEVQVQEELSKAARQKRTADTETIEALKDLQKAKEIVDPKTNQKRPPTLEELGYEPKVAKAIRKAGWVERYGNWDMLTTKGRLELSYAKGEWPFPTKSHKEVVEQALSEGKPVPPEVLADYPDLQAKYGKTSPKSPIEAVATEGEKATDIILTSDELPSWTVGGKTGVPLDRERLTNLKITNPKQGWIEVWRQDRADAPTEGTRPYSHWGTREQAEAIAQREREAGRPLGKLHHAFIKVTNPLETFDGGFWDKPIKEAIEKGNDSVVYQNEGEKAGGKSYIPLSADQIRDIPSSPAPGPEGKEPWQMTREEFARTRPIQAVAFKYKGKVYPGSALEIHAAALDRLVQEGKLSEADADKIYQNPSTYGFINRLGKYISREEAGKSAMSGPPEGSENVLRLKREHLDSVQAALEMGKPVPPEVLAEYPDLAEKYKAASPKPPEAVATEGEKAKKPTSAADKAYATIQAKYQRAERIAQSKGKNAAADAAELKARADADLEKWKKKYPDAAGKMEPEPAAPAQEEVKPSEAEPPVEPAEQSPPKKTVPPPGHPEAGFVLNPIQEAKEIAQKIKDALTDTPFETAHKKQVAKGVDVMTQHEMAGREADMTALRIQRLVDRAVPAERQDVFADAVEMGPDHDSWRQLTLPERTLAAQLREWAEAANKQALKNGLIKSPIQFEGTQIHVFHHWIDKDTGQPYTGNYGKFSKSTPQAKQRTIESIAAGREAGLTPAGNIGEMLGEQLKSVAYAAQTRNMVKSMGRDGTFKSWAKVVKDGTSDNYVRVSEPLFRKKVVFKDPEGQVHVVGETDGAIDKDLYPYWKAYRENPTYGNFSKFISIVTNWKLALSLFHPMTLARTTLELGRSPSGFVRGAKIRAGAPDNAMDRALYKQGLEHQAYDPMRATLKSHPVRTVLGQTALFEYLVPNMKWYVAHKNFESALRKLPDFDWSEEAFKRKDVEDMARQVVRQTDRFYSGEDVKRAGLESTALMNKMYYSPLARKLWAGALISPTWQKAHILAAKDVAKSIIGDAASQRLGAKQSISATKGRYLTYFGSVLTAMGISDAINYYNTKEQDGQGKHVWENPEGQGFSIRMPWNSPEGKQVYSRPFKSEIEVAEMLNSLKKVATGTLESGNPLSKFISKASPVVGAGVHQVFPPYPGQFKKGAWPRLKQLASDIGTPIGVGTGGEYLAKTAAEKIAGKPVLGKPDPDFDFITKTLMPFFGSPTSELTAKQAQSLTPMTGWTTGQLKEKEATTTYKTNQKAKGDKPGHRVGDVKPKSEGLAKVIEEELARRSKK